MKWYLTRFTLEPLVPSAIISYQLPIMNNNNRKHKYRVQNQFTSKRAEIQLFPMLESHGKMSNSIKGHIQNQKNQNFYSLFGSNELYKILWNSIDFHTL